ncbi:hypothetical protein NDU88_005733 [Pleurodeles waltl]|uniref:Uncharacterized protein n=1 Tax=Pleurodeles waltl TaxID=8319 RepID=A0AAV7PJR1_PLEWA|nr:hypothetical protein NDU88_005733 [Pleurodeles waltl]
MDLRPGPQRHFYMLAKTSKGLRDPVPGAFLPGFLPGVPGLELAGEASPGPVDFAVQQAGDQGPGQRS